MKKSVFCGKKTIWNLTENKSGKLKDRIGEQSKKKELASLTSQYFPGLGCKPTWVIEMDFFLSNEVKTSLKITAKKRPHFFGLFPFCLWSVCCVILNLWLLDVLLCCLSLWFVFFLNGSEIITWGVKKKISDFTCDWFYKLKLLRGGKENWSNVI